MENKNEIFYRNLVILFKLFKNSPNHLSKYLIKNTAFTTEFIDSIINSKKLNSMRPKEDQDYFNSNTHDENMIFASIEDMEEYYENIISEIDTNIDGLELEIQLNEQLSNLLSDEKFEEAAKIRDYMTIHNLNIYD